MRSISLPLLSAAFLLTLTGCGTVKYERANFDGAAVTNPTLGRGVSYKIPSGYAFLNPYFPLPTKPQNAAFENYMRQLTAVNNKPDQSLAFRECMLFRNDDRYLVIVHASLNLSATFRSMGPGVRTLLMPELASAIYRYFDTPHRDFNFTVDQVKGRNIINFPPFTPQAAGAPSQGWQGTGFSLLGDRTDIVAVVVFARDADLASAQADIRSIQDNFTYGPTDK